MSSTETGEIEYNYGDCSSDAQSSTGTSYGPSDDPVIDLTDFMIIDPMEAG